MHRVPRAEGGKNGRFADGRATSKNLPNLQLSTRRSELSAKVVFEEELMYFMRKNGDISCKPPPHYPGVTCLLYVKSHKKPTVSGHDAGHLAAAASLSVPRRAGTSGPTRL